jgi:hypothetical protein
MKSEFDKEIDRLLRGHAEAARRGGASTSAAEGAARGGNGHDGATETFAHLDADELSAYAENALPARARVRYAAHLADCDNCRRMATGIALASGVAGELDKREAATGKQVGQPVKASWLARLADFFSPRSLRYVAPVLVAALVGVVAFVALRQSSSEMSLSRRNESSASANVSETTASRIEPESSAQTIDTNTNANANMRASVPAGTLAESAPDAKSKPAPAPGEMAKSDAPPPAKDAGGGAASNVTSETTTTLAAPPAASKAGPPPEKKAEIENLPVQTRSASPVQTADKERSAQQEENVYAGAANASNRAAVGQNKKRAGGEDAQQLPAQNRGYEQQQPARNEQREEPRDEDRARADQRAESRTRSNTQKTVPELSARSPRRSDTATTKNKSANAAPESGTRSVAGRRFRKQNGVWVDTAYNSSQSPTNIARNSESFRSLVADEPELARLARELDGPIIVVWKNRAYRIR